MSTSLLYHAFRVRGYHYQSTNYTGGGVTFTITQPRESYRCAVCGSVDGVYREHRGVARAAPQSDGVFYDPADQLFKMWYRGGTKPKPEGAKGYYDGYGRYACYVTSRDGIHWDRPELDVVPGTNAVIVDEEGTFRCANTVWLDLEETDPAKRFKMFTSTRSYKIENDRMVAVKQSYWIYFSPDGIFWTFSHETPPGMGDRSTVFYNPFRRVWVFSMKHGRRDLCQGARVRAYHETKDLLNGPWWPRATEEQTLWVGADRLDPDRSDLNLRRVPERPWDLCPSQIYCLDCVAYESLMLGAFTILRGHLIASERRGKINEVCVGYSRDGFHWSRPDRRAFCPVSEERGAWNFGNVQSAAGFCLVVGDKLHFYVSGCKAQRNADPNTTGLAVLRRDGFTSMDAGPKEGTLTTRPVTFRGTHCFVNVAAPTGELRVEVLDADGKAIAPFTKANCEPIAVDGTIHPVTWRGTKDLSALAGKPVRFRFHLRQGQLYSFWVSAHESGASGGYVAAGGPGFTASTDTVGMAAYEAAERQTTAAEW